LVRGWLRTIGSGGHGNYCTRYEIIRDLGGSVKRSVKRKCEKKERTKIQRSLETRKNYLRKERKKLSDLCGKGREKREEKEKPDNAEKR
jgi:hypothetical protein